ncbi:MAG TPA: DNA double-strand break repair nuclease NurA [Ktedonobacterales bacterium]|nr:DNA double-strand break repair nuclease NurA [Ktedonobacterales bacterium]
MLHAGKTLDELARQRERLLSYQERHGDGLEAYREALATLRERFPTAAALEAAQAAARAARADEASGPPSLGARPTAEYDRWIRETAERLPALRFGQRFATHEDARAWAERLRGVTTFAVDGSQLPPWRDASLPVALAQAGLFENPHQPPQPYIKDVTVRLITPEELTGDEPEASDARAAEDTGYSSRFVQLRRFELEVETVITRMEHHHARRAKLEAAGETPPLVVAFYDGSLIVSFALKAPPPYRERYVGAARRLLEASARCRVPLVAYIDTSYARDMLAMLRTLAGSATLLPETRGLSDPALWRGDLEWGDRTPAFLSARYDLGRMGYGDSGAHGEGVEVGFVYFQAALDRPPARIEFPSWLLDAGLLDQVMDVVRAEVIAGTGYPYPIEAADAVAVISARDRAEFYALFQGFAEREGLRLSFSRKALSKSRRRV